MASEKIDCQRSSRESSRYATQVDQGRGDSDMETANTHKPANRTLVVIDGGMNFKASVQTIPTAPRPKLLDEVRQAIRTRHSIRTRHYSPKTEESYVHWIKRFIFFHNKRHPAEMAEPEIARFLSSLATESRVSGSTQNQALNALLFLYHQVLTKEIGYVNGVVRAKKAPRLPVVLTRGENSSPSKLSQRF
jgi:hypothetical protein